MKYEKSMCLTEKKQMWDKQLSYMHELIQRISWNLHYRQIWVNGSDTDAEGLFLTNLYELCVCHLIEE